MNEAERFEERELAKIQNQLMPVSCPKCGGTLQFSSGMVGEKVLMCRKHGIVWEDAIDAVRRVI